MKQAGAVGFPRFKSKHNSYQSYQSSTANVKDGKLYLPKIGQIKTKFHRGAIIGKIKTVTVSREANQYFFLHKISNQLSENQTVKVEDLKIKNMSKQAKGSIENPNMRASAKSGLNRSILQQSWGKFFELLEYKLHRNGGVLVKVDPKFTSQKCSECGHTAKENRLKQELFVCAKCSFTANADYIPFIFKKMDNLQSPYLLAS